MMGGTAADSEPLRTSSSPLSKSSMSSPQLNLSDPRFQRYYQAVRNAEIGRQVQLWMAQGASEEVARRNAQTGVLQDLELNATHSLYLCMAAMRAMQSDFQTHNFAGSVAQAVLEYESMIAAEQSPAVSLAALLQQQQQQPPPPQAPPPPPPPPSRTSLRFGPPEINIPIPSSSQATRLMGQRWVKAAYQALAPSPPPDFAGSAEQWAQCVQDFCRLVVEGLSRHPEEGSAMRWLTLPQPDAALVLRVSQNPRQFRDSLPGYYTAPRSRTSSLSSLSSRGSSSAKRRRVAPTEQAKRQARAERFHGPPTRKITSWQEKLALNGSPHRVVGRSTALEKPYLRLCGPPDPNLVRTESALHVSFFHVMRKFLAFSSSSSAYNFIDEQLRSIRQDFVVQGLQTSFLFLIYCVNARVSLIFHDLGQFNQCQSQLKVLERVLPATTTVRSLPFQTEVTALRLLYAAVNGLDADYLKLRRHLPAASDSPAELRWVFRVRDALQEHNYARFMKLVGGASSSALDKARAEELRVVSAFVTEFERRWNPGLAPDALTHLIKDTDEAVWAAQQPSGGIPFFCRALVRVALPRIQMQYLLILSRAHYNLSIDCIQSWLGHSDNDECLRFLRSQNAVFAEDGSLDCRQSHPIFVQSPLLSKKIKAMG